MKRFLLLLGFFMCCAEIAHAQIWAANKNGNWNDAANWTPASVPNSTGATATFGSAIKANRTVTIVSPVTVGTLNFNNSKNYTIAGNTLNLDASSGSALINVSGTGSQTISAPINLADPLSITQNGGGLTLSGNLNTNWNAVTVSGTGPTTISGAIQQGGNLTKAGTGDLTISGNNSSWSGNLIVQEGTAIISNSNALGSANWGNEVDTNASLQLKNGVTVQEGNIQIQGSGNSTSAGAIVNNGGNNTLNSTITLAGDSKITSQSGQLTTQGTLSTGGNQLTVSNATGATTRIESQIQGTGAITYSGGTTTLAGTQSNTANGTTTVSSGTLNLDKTGGAQAIVGDLSIGSGATVKLLENNQIGDYQTTSLNSNATLDLNGKSDTLKNLTFNGGGTAQLNNGYLTLNNSGGGVTYQAGSQTGTITGGTVDIQGYVYKFDVANGSNAVDLKVNGTMTGNAILQKTGEGTMQLTGTGNNQFNGAIVDKGMLSLNKTSGDAIGAGTITVNSGGTLLLTSSNQIGNTVNMVLNGGNFSTGASTTDTVGTLTLAANSVIDLASSTVLHFANSASTWWNGVLDIVGWDSSSSIFFGNDASGLTTAQLSNITFEGFGQGALILSDGRITPNSPVPEASVMLGLFLLVGFILYREYPRIGKFLCKLTKRFV